MNPGSPLLSIILPAHNEEGRILPTLHAVAEQSPAWPWRCEVIVVDDGSTDRTAEVSATYASRLPGLTVLRHDRNRGKGAAVATGMLNSTGSHRLFLDADGATPVDQVPVLMQTALGHPHTIVIGSVACPGAQVEQAQSAPRVVAGRLGRHLIGRLVLPGVRDSQRGCKLFPAEACEPVFTRTTVRGWAFDVEALALGAALGYEIVEVPVRWSHQPGGTLGPSAYTSSLADVVRIRRRLLADAYGIGTGQVPRLRGDAGRRPRLAPLRQPT